MRQLLLCSDKYSELKTVGLACGIIESTKEEG